MSNTTEDKSLKKNAKPETLPYNTTIIYQLLASYLTKNISIIMMHKHKSHNKGNFEKTIAY